MPLPRLQLFELEDLSWFPSQIRDLATDYLHFMETQFALHEPVLPLLQTLLLDAGTCQIVDLCSGGGGPALAIQEAFATRGITVRITLTDKYPNLEAFARLTSLRAPHIRHSAQSVDATDVPESLIGLRTIFNAYHHFAPHAARAVLASAVRARQPIGIFEIPERSLPAMLPLFFTPLFVWIATPFIRPFRWKRLLFTYLIPLVPLTCWWDGLVSAWRAYTPSELMRLTEGLEDYDWQAGREPFSGKPGHVTWLRGVPRSLDPSA